MIETTTIYICDICKSESNVGDKFYQLHKQKVETVIKEYANHNWLTQPIGDVTKVNVYKWHVCQHCMYDIEQYIGGK